MGPFVIDGEGEDVADVVVDGGGIATRLTSAG